MATKKILVVDDDPHIVRLVAVNLERSGYDVLKAYDGVEALEVIERELPDMCVIDDNMPRITGLELLKKIRQRWPQLPVIGLCNAPDGFAFWVAGVNLYLTKPFNPLELLTCIRNIFAAQAEPVSI